MTNPNNNPSQENLDYQRALEVTREASEAVLQELGKEAVRHAEDITFDSGVAAPALAVTEAEIITKGAAISSEAEDYLGGGIAAQAQDYLKKQDELAKERATNQALVEAHGVGAVIDKYNQADFKSMRREFKPNGYSDLLD